MRMLLYPSETICRHSQVLGWQVQHKCCRIIRGKSQQIRGEEGPDGSDLRFWSSNPEESQHNGVWTRTEVVIIEETLKAECD